MTANTFTGSTGLCRCAVCKIDLRGRFVVIDSQTEKLLGYVREELFGKSVLDYLDIKSRNLIERVLSERNHYETHYDYASLALLSKSRRAIDVDVMISLCFAGGNPVNYQLILREQNQPSRPTGEFVGGVSIEEFVEGCLAFDSANRLDLLPDMLCRYCMAEQVAIYLIDEDRLEPRAGAQAGSPELFSFDAISELTELHRQVAQTGEVYAFCDEVAVQAAREADIEPPPEFVTTAFFEDQFCLLRFVFSEDMPIDNQPQAVSHARLVVQLAAQLFNSAPTSSENSDPGIDMKFTIGFLSALNIGALLTDSDGKIVGYNPALVEILDDLSPGETSRDFVRLLDGNSDQSWTALLHEQLMNSDTADLRIDLTLPSGEDYLLNIIRLANEAGDQTACWALVPRSRPAESEFEITQETSVWSSLVDGMRPALDELTDGAEQLSRDYCRQAKNLDDSGLNRLHDAVRTMHQMLADSSLLHTRRSSTGAVAVSLSDLVDEATETVRGEFPEVTINCKHDQLPTIKTSRLRLTAVLRNLMANCVRHNPNNEVTLSVEARTVADRCRIVVTDKEAGMPRQQFQRLFDFYLPSTTTDIPRRNSGVGLALSRLLMHDLGGKIRGASKEGVGTRLAIMLPQPIRGVE